MSSDRIPKWIIEYQTRQRCLERPLKKDRFCFVVLCLILRKVRMMVIMMITRALQWITKWPINDVTILFYGGKWVVNIGNKEINSLKENHTAYLLQ